MDEQATSTPDPVTTNSPVTEPMQAEPVPAAESTQPLTPSEPITKTPTAQLAGSEPLADPASAGVGETLQPTQPTGTAEATQSPSTPGAAPAQQEPASLPASMPAQAPVIVIQQNRIKDFFAKAAQAIQFRKQKKLTKIMALFLKKTHITNDEVEKLLHVSDATATRYLSQLEKQGKIKQSAKTGKGVMYTKLHSLT